jgi:hypothetical protein
MSDIVRHGADQRRGRIFSLGLLLLLLLGLLCGRLLVRRRGCL